MSVEEGESVLVVSSLMIVPMTESAAPWTHDEKDVVKNTSPKFQLDAADSCFISKEGRVFTKMT
jgi:hypothetical protein